MTTILTGNREVAVPGASGTDDQLWLAAGELAAATGWQLKPEGLCQDEVCVAIPAGREREFVQAGRVNLAAFWRHLGHPVLHDESGAVWVLGERARDRGARLASLVAPDFTLPDLAGHPHSLSEYRGRKVLLVTWASW